MEELRVAWPTCVLKEHLLHTLKTLILEKGRSPPVARHRGSQELEERMPAHDSRFAMQNQASAPSPPRTRMST